ncbi:MAG: acylphosphatase [Humidesulfovibrio sp.]|nr:acylphosphatase [Humidesulfovibrio sp.]
MDTPLSFPTLSFRVTGLVQHVWFRGWTQMTAGALGLNGWVRNLSDGSVAGQAQAADDSEEGGAGLARFRELLAEGPPTARVSRVEAELLDLPERFHDFQVRF